MSVTVAVAQFAPTDDKAANTQAIVGFLRDAHSVGAGLLALPEYSSFMTPRIDERIVQEAEPLDGPFVHDVAEAARAAGVAVVLGINEAIPGEPRVHNTLVMIGADGVLLGTYRKLHLYDAFGSAESKWIAPGPIVAPCTFVIDDVTFGAQTCYDLRFPEVMRTLVDAGAHAVLVPAQWVPGPLKEDHWTTLLRARAIENTVYVVAAGQAPPYGCGRSMIVDPMGITVSALGEQVGTVAARIERQRVDAVRQKNPSLAARRFGVVPLPTS